MHAVHIRVVSVTGDPLTTGQALLRTGAVLWIFTPLVAGVAAGAIVGTSAAAGFVLISLVAVGMLGLAAVIHGAVNGDRGGLFDRVAGSRIISVPVIPIAMYGAPPLLWQTPGPTSLYPAPPGLAQPPPTPPVHPTSAHATDLAGAALGATAARPDQPPVDPVRRGWRSTVTWGRSPWTWTDVLPVIGLFIPALHGANRLLTTLVHRVQPHAPSGFVKGAELVVLEALTYGGCLLLLAITVGIRRRSGLRALGMGRFHGRWLWMAFPALLASYALEISTGIVSRSLFPGTPNNQCIDIRASFAGYLPVAIIVASVFAPVIEETFFRGFLLRYLRDRMPWGVALVISAALFSAGHFSYNQPTIFLPIFCAGLILGGLYLWSGSIWPGILTHAMFNLVPVLVLFLGNAPC